MKVNVPVTFMMVAIDEGPGPTIKYQYTELGKLHQLVSCLVRCCDISSKCQTYQSNGAVTSTANPYRDATCPEPIMPLSPQACELLFTRTR